MTRLVVAGQEQVDDSNTTGDDDGDGPADQGVALERELDALAARAATGDRDAVSELLERIRTPVVRLCRARMSGRAIGGNTPEDVAQEVLIAVLGALGRFRTGDTRWMAFVNGIVRNKVTDAFRAAGRDRSEPYDELPDSGDDELDGPEASALRHADRQLIARLMGGLNENQRDVIYYRVALGYSAEETARLLGTTAGAVRVSQHRALARMRVLLAQEMAGGSA